MNPLNSFGCLTIVLGMIGICSPKAISAQGKVEQIAESSLEEAAKIFYVPWRDIRSVKVEVEERKDGRTIKKTVALADPIQGGGIAIRQEPLEKLIWRHMDMSYRRYESAMIPAAEYLDEKLANAIFQLIKEHEKLRSEVVGSEFWNKMLEHQQTGFERLTQQSPWNRTDMLDQLNTEKLAPYSGWLNVAHFVQTKNSVLIMADREQARSAKIPLPPDLTGVMGRMSSATASSPELSQFLNFQDHATAKFQAVKVELEQEMDGTVRDSIRRTENIARQMPDETKEGILNWVKNANDEELQERQFIFDGVTSFVPENLANELFGWRPLRWLGQTEPLN